MLLCNALQAELAVDHVQRAAVVDHVLAGQTGVFPVAPFVQNHIEDEHDYSQEWCKNYIGGQQENYSGDEFHAPLRRFVLGVLHDCCQVRCVPAKGCEYQVVLGTLGVPVDSERVRHLQAVAYPVQAKVLLFPGLLVQPVVYVLFFPGFCVLGHLQAVVNFPRFFIHFKFV